MKKRVYILSTTWNFELIENHHDGALVKSHKSNHYNTRQLEGIFQYLLRAILCLCICIAFDALRVPAILKFLKM